MDRYRCSVCKKELTEGQVLNYMEHHKDLDFNWGQCEGKNATIELLPSSVHKANKKGDLE